MGEVSATASISARIGVGHKKGWGSHDGITPHHSITLKKDVSSDDDDVLVAEADKLWNLARKLTEAKIAEDVKELKKVD